MNRIINYDDLTSHGNITGRKIMAEIMDAGLTSADPYFNTKKLVRLEGDKLIFDGKDYEAPDDPNAGVLTFDLSEIDRVFVFAIGKGIQRIAKALEEILGDRLTGGHVLGKIGDTPIMEKLEMSFGGHPVPNEACVEGCKRIVEKIENAHLTERDLVITAIGNGVSSLCTYPAEGVTLSDVMEITRLMQIEYGVPTGELNHIRNNVDRLKGGRITRMLQPAKTVHLLGVPITINGKNGFTPYDGLLHNNIWLHTLSDRTTATEALAVIRRWDTKNKAPGSIVEYLENFDEKNATMRAEEFIATGARVFGLMPEHIDAITGAMDKAKELGFNTYLMTRSHVCEASQAGLLASSVAMYNATVGNLFKLPAALFSTGEMLVTCGENPGVGGRNQEFCLSAAKNLKGSRRVVMASCDTDGTDGPGGYIHPDAEARGITNLAGGMVDGYTVAEAEAKGIDIFEQLKCHATSNPLWEIGCGIAATQNISINDLTITLIFDKDL